MGTSKADCNTALITMFREALDSDIITDVKTDIDAMTDYTFLQVFTRFMEKHGHANPQDLLTTRSK